MANLDSTKKNRINLGNPPQNMSIKSYAKINIFLKITGYQNGYHKLLSRFAKVENLYDEIEFIPKKCNQFTINGFSNLPTEENLIYKTYQAINKYLPRECKSFFKEHIVNIKKRIPEGAGLGGGSSNSASFLILLNRVCNLGLDKKTLAKIGSKVGADVPFFVYDYRVANVKGFGEIVEEFEDVNFNIEIFTPDIHSNTAQVYRHFRENFLKDINPNKFMEWEFLNSKKILENSSIAEANDLFKSALLLYPKLENYIRDGWYFSGSGSSFFKIDFK